MTDYYQKYLKYKQKYVGLKMQLGGTIVDIVVLKEDKTYVTYLDRNKFLKFNLDEMNLDEIIEYSEVTHEKEKIEDFINNNLDKKYIYLSNFYMLSPEEDKTIHESIKVKREIIDSEIEKLKLKESEELEKLKKIEELEKDKENISVPLFANSKIMTEDIRGLGKQILFFILYCLYGNEIVLCLEPILGDNKESHHFSNIDKRDEDRYRDLIHYYKKNIYSQDNLIEVEAKTLFKQYQLAKSFGDVTFFNQVKIYNRVFMMGIISLNKNKIIKDQKIYESIRTIKWGFGIENEAGLKKVVHDINSIDVINTFYTKDYINLATQLHKEDERDKFNFSYSEKKIFYKIITNPKIYIEGNDKEDLMLKSTTIFSINKNIEEYIKELKDERENNLIVFNKVFNEIFKESATYYNGEQYENIYQTRKTDKKVMSSYPKYLGSYHFNITLPHEEKIESTEIDSDFIKQHIIYANLLQLFEPLLLAIYGSKQYSQEKFIDIVHLKDKEETSNYYGFELRLMDYFPIKHLEQFCNLLWLIAFKFYQSYIKSWKITDMESYNEIVVKQIKLIKAGSNTSVDKDYFSGLTKICRELNINITELKNTNTYELLNSIYKEMVKSYNLYKSEVEKSKDSKDPKEYERHTLILKSYIKILKDLKDDENLVCRY